MKRSLLLSLFAVAIVAMTVGQALAAVDVQLNLFYNDPADPSEGGSWDLLAQTDVAAGLAGITVKLTDVTYVSNNNATLGWNIFKTSASGNVTELVFGYDLTGTFPAGIGTASGAGNVAVDDLKNPAWNNSVLLASGTFGGTRPGFDATEPLAANEVSGTNAVLATNGVMSVRGDSVSLDGLPLGDANRDWAVGPSDLGAINLNWAPTATNKTWATGDFNDDGAVGPSDLGALNLNWNPTGTGITPPAIAAVPEPATAALLLLASVGLCARRTRG